ncbi:MAG: zf-HC2 domain-containing protein [Bacteroidetes bacterium]|nr:zf-HC2 domain-containing protein [Bacteroidota bacterium]
MDCREFQGLISAAVDRYLSSEELEIFLEHAKKCPPCQDEYESEITTKHVVQSRTRMVKTPVAVARVISDTLERETASRRAHREPRWREILRKPLMKPALALALVVVMFLLYMDNSPQRTDQFIQASLPGNDVILQSFANYLDVETGAIKPQVVSTQPERVKDYFMGKTQFPVLVRAMRECTLVGAVLNEYSGAPLAHVVYKHAGQIVYLYQACWETVQEGDQLRLPDSVRFALKESGVYTETRSDGRTIALWTDGETLCAAVSRLDRDALLACIPLNASSSLPR